MSIISNWGVKWNSKNVIWVKVSPAAVTRGKASLGKSDRTLTNHTNRFFSSHQCTTLVLSTLAISWCISTPFNSHALPKYFKSHGPETQPRESTQVYLHSGLAWAHSFQNILFKNTHGRTAFLIQSKFPHLQCYLNLCRNPCPPSQHEHPFCWSVNSGSMCWLLLLHNSNDCQVNVAHWVGRDHEWS